MLKLLLASHGKMAEGMKSAVELLIGKQENLTVISAYVEGRNIDKELAAYFASLDKEDQLVMLSDLYGGSVNQKMYLYLDRPNTFLVSGINLALLLELCMAEEVTLQKLQTLVEQSRKLQKVIVFDEEEKQQEDADFF